MAVYTGEEGTPASLRKFLASVRCGGQGDMVPRPWGGHVPGVFKAQRESGKVGSAGGRGQIDPVINWFLNSAMMGRLKKKK